MQARPEMLQPLMEQLAQVIVLCILFLDCGQAFDRNSSAQTIPPEILQAIQENQEVHLICCRAFDFLLHGFT